MRDHTVDLFLQVPGAEHVHNATEIRGKVIVIWILHHPSGVNEALLLAGSPLSRSHFAEQIEVERPLKRSLVTGGAGFMGSHVAEHLLRK